MLIHAKMVLFSFGRSTKKDSELVVISSSSSDDDSDKELKTDTVEPVVKKEEAETFPDVVKSKLQVNQTESLEQDSKQIKVATEPKVERKDSDLDECISQEDLLAQLGLSSVKELNKKETSNMENSTPSANANGVERKPLISHRAKESIVEFLKIPKLSSLDSRKKNNGEVKGDVKITNGNTSDGSRPDSPLSDENDDDLQAKEKLIAHLRNELKQEEAKLLLLKQLHAAQNDVKGSSKFQKENVEKVQTQGASSQPVKSSMQLPPKKGQNLPPPPPLKASAVLAISTFHPPRDVPGQPRLLPKGSSNAQLQSSNSGSSKITLIFIDFVCDCSVKFLPSSFPGSSVFLLRERKRGDLGARLNFLSSKVQ